jgi:hypothetical protein
MAAGLGFKTFTTGEVLTAADTNGYLMQGVLVFASSAARAAAITSPQEGQYSYLKDTNSTEYYDGAAWIAAPIGDITGVTAGTGISGGGTSGTVTITNSMATEITAAGDIIVGTGSGTFDNLPIGTTAQVLTADTTVSPYKVKWATPAAAASGMTLIVRTSFSNVASVTMDSIFSSTYKSYMVMIEKVWATTPSDDLQMSLRYGSTTQSADYYGASGYASYNSASFANIQVNNSTVFTMLFNTGSGSVSGNSATLFFTHVGNASEAATWSGTAIDYYANNAHFIGGLNGTQQTYTGLLFKTAASNISGTIAVYGLAAA